MSVEITQFTHPPIPAHLAGVRRIGLGLARWASRADARRVARLEAARERVLFAWEMREEFARIEQERERAWIDWQLHHLH